MNGKRRQACTIAVWAANVSAAPRGRAGREVVDELLVVLAQRGQVPGLVDHPRGLPERAELGPEGQQLRRLPEP